MNDTILPESFPLIEPYIEGMGLVTTVVDVGCWLMNETRAMRERWPLATIICFEPDPRSIVALVESGTPAELNAQLFPCALGNQGGKANLWMSTNLKDHAEPGKQFYQASSLRMPRDFGDRASLVANPFIFEEAPVPVTVMPLDSMIPLCHLRVIDLLWIDAQGCEDAIISGAPETLKRTRYMFMEHNTDGAYVGAPDLHSLMALLPDWEAIKVFPYDVLLRNKAHA